MESLPCDFAEKVQQRNKTMAEAFLCECMVRVRGVLCQKSKANVSSVGDRLYLQVEDVGYGPSLVVLLPGEVMAGHVAKEDAETLIPMFMEPCFVVSDW